MRIKEAKLPYHMKIGFGNYYMNILAKEFSKHENKYLPRDVVTWQKRKNIIS